MRAYSLDLRQRIVAAVEEGASLRTVAQKFAVSAASVCRYINQHKRTQTLTPKPRPGGKPKLEAATLVALQERVQEKPDQTVAQLQAWLIEQFADLHVSPVSVYRALVRCGFTYKKRLWLPPSEMRKSEPPGAKR